MKSVVKQPWLEGLANNLTITSQQSWTDGVELNIYMIRNIETQINPELQGAFVSSLECSFLASAFIIH